MNRGTLKKQTNKQKQKTKKTVKLQFVQGQLLFFIIQMTSNHYFTAFLE